MPQTDYIMRIIEQFADFLWAIVLNKKVQNYDLALKKIDEAYSGLLFSDAGQIKNLSVIEILEDNTNKSVLNKDNIEVIANLLFEEADILENINGNNFTSFEYYQKSIELFLKLFDETANTQYCKNIDDIITKLENYEIGDDLNKKIFEYYFAMGYYGKAEDKLYDLMESKSPISKNEIMIFYEILLKKDDLDLEKGNLPRKEIIEAIKAMEYLDTKNRNYV
jgi:hypothetical protein